jgi:hypothetical protein
MEKNNDNDNNRTQRKSMIKEVFGIQNECKGAMYKFRLRRKRYQKHNRKTQQYNIQRFR